MDDDVDDDALLILCAIYDILLLHNFMFGEINQ